METVKRSMVTCSRRDRGITRWSTEGFQGSETTLYDTTMVMHVVMHLSKPVECTTPRANPNVNYGLWVVMMCQGRFIIITNVPSGRDVDNGGACACWGTGGRMKISVISTLFC